MFGHGPEQQPQPTDTPLSTVDRGHLAHIFIILFSIGLAQLFHSNIFKLWGPPLIDLQQIFLLWIPAALLPVLLHYLIGSWSESYREHWHHSVDDTKECSILTKTSLALGAALGEELLFRCVLQPWTGILPIVLLVGVLTPNNEGRPTPITALCAAQALLYGQMVEVTGSIWPSLFAHSVMNLWFVFYQPVQDESFA